MTIEIPNNYPTPGSNFGAVASVNPKVYVWFKTKSGYASTADFIIGAGTTPPTDVGLFAQGCKLTILENGQFYINTALSGLAPTWVYAGTTTPSTSTGALAATVTAKVSLTSAQILALNTTPVTLLAAPAAGTVYNIVNVYGRIDFLTAAYATHTALDITDATTGNILFSDSGTLLAATSTKVSTVPVNTNSGAGVVVTAAGAIAATVATGNPVTGAGSLDLYITYTITTL